MLQSMGSQRVRHDLATEQPQCLGSGKGLPPVCKLRTSHPHVIEEVRSPVGLLIRALMPSTRDPPSRPGHLLKVLPPKTISLRVRISTQGFRGTRHSFSNILFVVIPH